jgi:hypothetical protein
MKSPFAIQRDLLIGRNGTDQFGLVFFAEIEEKLDRIITRPDFAADRDIPFGQLGHTLFDGHQVFRCKRTLVGEIIIEAVFDDRANGDLRLGEQLLDCIGQQVGGRVADNFQAIGIALGNDGQIDILGQSGKRYRPELAIHLAGQRRAGQTSANAAATSAMVTGCSKERMEPSGNLILGMVNL